MRIILIILAISALLTLPLSTMASPDCPPANSIQTKALKQASRLDSQRWSFISGTFNHDLRSWNVLFITELPQVKNTKEALRRGIKNFQRTAITNHEPFPQDLNGINYCYYTSPTGNNRIAAMSFKQDG